MNLSKIFALVSLVIIISLVFIVAELQRQVDGREKQIDFLNNKLIELNCYKEVKLKMDKEWKSKKSDKNFPNYYSYPSNTRKY